MGGKAPYVEEVLTMTPQQMQVMNMLGSVLGGQVGQGIQAYPGQMYPGESPLQTQTFEAAQKYLGRVGDPEAARAYWETAVKEPAMETWKKDVIPGIQEQFIGQGTGASSGINRAIAESGKTLTTGLSSQLESILRGEEARLPGTFQAMGGLGGEQRGIQSELLREPYEKWQMAQPWANPWLQYLGPFLNLKQWDFAAMPGRQGWGSVIGSLLKPLSQMGGK